MFPHPVFPHSHASVTCTWYISYKFYINEWSTEWSLTSVTKESFVRISFHVAHSHVLFCSIYIHHMLFLMNFCIWYDVSVEVDFHLAIHSDQRLSFFPLNYLHTFVKNKLTIIFLCKASNLLHWSICVSTILSWSLLYPQSWNQVVQVIPLFLFQSCFD